MLIPLKLVRDQQLQQQIFDQLRDLIVSNRLRPGARMPSTRMMAEQFSISRMTVLLTYERLTAEGYLETRPAAGTFVARPTPRSPAHAATDASILSLAHQRAASQDAGQGGQPGGAGPVGREARVGAADGSLFPAQRWRALMRAGLDRMGAHPGADHPAGNPDLREAIASWLSTSRGLAVAPDQVMLVKGRQQALHVVAHLASRPCEGRRAMTRDTMTDHTMTLGAGGLAESVSLPGCPHENQHGDVLRALRGEGRERAMDLDQARIVVEDPCDGDAAAALAGEGGALVRVPVDADGLRVDLLPPGEAALIHVTPEHQRPLGAILSRERRIALLYWATHAGALIVEEDIDGEVRFGDMKVPPLMSLDRSERVILLGGFGVSLAPWLDMAYLVLPRWLTPFAHAARLMMDDSRSGLEQMALAEFLRSGGYARHLHRLTKAYASRRDALLDAMRRHLGGSPLVWGEHAGLHLTWFPPPAAGSPDNLAALARVCGLDAAPVSADPRGRPPGPRALRLGFGLLPERQIEARIARFAGLMRTAPNASVRPAMTALAKGAFVPAAETAELIRGVAYVVCRTKMRWGLSSDINALSESGIITFWIAGPTVRRTFA